MPTQSLRLEDVAGWQGCALAYGHFNTIHPGHIRYLRHARGLGDRLVVALIGDGKTSYTFQQQERVEALSLLGIADALVLLEADELNEAIDALQPKVLVLGNEFKNNSEIQTTLLQQRQQGGAVQFHAGDIHYATADLLSGSERDLRQQRRSCSKPPAAVRASSQVNCWRPSRLGIHPLDCSGRYDRGSIRRLRSHRHERRSACGRGTGTRAQEFHRWCGRGGCSYQCPGRTMRFHLRGGGRQYG